MREDCCTGVVVECSANQFAREDATAVDGAREDVLYRDGSGAVVEPDHMKFFVRQVRQAHAEEVGGVSGLDEGREAREAAAQDVFGSGEDVGFGNGLAGGLVVA